ncbi:MAG: beta-lactamase family protein [Saprospiraceae bacterium]|nr:beta-lactamase family protein [Saprospiraceae bacterium]
MKKLIIILCFGLAACNEDMPGAVRLENCGSTKNAAIEAVGKRFLEAGTVGVNIALKSPQGEWNYSAGKADLANDIDLSPCHTLRIGSISKTFAAILIMKLQEEGKLSINDKAAKYLPEEYVKNVENLSEVTIKQVMQHTSGIRNYLEIRTFMDIYNGSLSGDGSKENVRRVFGKKAYFKPGENWQYSNTNYLLLAMIIEQIEGKSAYEVMKQKFFDPLQLQNTIAGKAPSSLSRGYYDSFNNGLMRDLTTVDYDAVGGLDMLDGGLISNAHDMNVFMDAFGKGKIISQASITEMQSPSNANVELPEELRYIKDYGLGLFLIDINGQKGFGHGGNVHCFNGVTYYFPDSGTSISILVNSYSTKIDKVLYDAGTLESLLQF